MTERPQWPAWLKSLDRRDTTCKSCKATVRWGRTMRGEKILMDPAPEDGGMMKSHWATCPNADQHRKRARAMQR